MNKMALTGKLNIVANVIVFFTAITACRALLSTPPNPKTVGQPWPMPQTYTPSSETLLLSDSSFSFVSKGHSCDILEEALDRYFGVIFYSRRASKRRDGSLFFHPWYKMGTMLTSLEVTVHNACDQYPSLDMDESYDLKVDPETGILVANSVWGALRGLETFSQIVYENENDQFQVNVTTITDYPRFAWRGVLLDTSRHYLEKEVIFQNLEAMAYNKMNVFHWHIVDSPSFPYQSRDYPDLSDKGAYDPYTHIYSQGNVQEIIEFGRKRGIRVVPEFDSPGHSESWGNGQADLLTKCYNKQGEPTGQYGPVDPTLNTTYTFLKGFMKELTEVFHDKYIHLGGDEVSFSCWKSNPKIQSFMSQHGYGQNYAKLEEYYMQNLLDIVGSYNSGYIIWQEVVDNGVKVNPNTVVEVWKYPYQSELYNVTKMGLHAILAAPWYLDYISYGADWKKYYAIEPLHFNGTAKQESLVMGGEACLWGEYVDDTNVESRLWPRASAIAERLWSPASVNNLNTATPRLEEHRCRMVRRGINAEPENGPSYCQYEASYATYLKWKRKQNL